MVDFSRNLTYADAGPKTNLCGKVPVVAIFAGFID